MESNIFGRAKEIDILKRSLVSTGSEFIAVYGRRRVGKTFLVKELLGNSFVFYATGILDGNMAVQRENFNDEIENFGGRNLPRATDWRGAFANLNRLIEQSDREAKKVVFLDEMPWMATANSDFLSALDYFWNRWASTRHDVLLIVCGSATSWIIDKIVNGVGGLHNRLTRQMMLRPFSLGESEGFCQSRGISISKYQHIEAYMMFGGIPYYLSLMDERLSLYQNIDTLYFEHDAPLRNEYDNLYRSLFRKADRHIQVIEALAQKGKGLTREELVGATGLTDGGGLTKVLEDLDNNGFIRVYRAFGKKAKGRIYQLMDPFTLFHLRFAERRATFSDRYWLQFVLTPAYHAWSGIAFERVCMQHISQIKQALGISGVLTEISAWRSREEDPGAQIDLVIDRHDRTVNLCEMKFASTELTVDKRLAESLRSKRAAFLSETGTDKSAATTLISPLGIRSNKYSGEIHSSVSAADLFAN